MTKDIRHNDPALREALRMEQEQQPCLLMPDGWQEQVMAQITDGRPARRRHLWMTAAASIAVLLAITATLTFQKRSATKQPIEAVTHTPLPHALTPPTPSVAKALPSSSSPKKKSLRRYKKHDPIIPTAATTEPDDENETVLEEEPFATSARATRVLASNRDRMRQAMFQKMSQMEEYKDVEPETTEEI